MTKISSVLYEYKILQLSNCGLLQRNGQLSTTSGRHLQDQVFVLFMLLLVLGATQGGANSVVQNRGHMYLMLSHLLDFSSISEIMSLRSWLRADSADSTLNGGAGPLPSACNLLTFSKTNSKYEASCDVSFRPEQDDTTQCFCSGHAQRQPAFILCNWMATGPHETAKIVV